ncbi:hypothetical protein E2C01_070797 [Portunus trituberculatus]|uniref:Uncharacterized protein n=1 Tax=Portunus trituberculatus TaxID=210409 RepID=A0A5B7I4J9_PORTR|nr:hypothetical protein [Portunus trituberculatus]
MQWPGIGPESGAVVRGLTIAEEPQESLQDDRWWCSGLSAAASHDLHLGSTVASEGSVYEKLCSWCPPVG